MGDNRISFFQIPPINNIKLSLDEYYKNPSLLGDLLSKNNYNFSFNLKGDLFILFNNKNSIKINIFDMEIQKQIKIHWGLKQELDSLKIFLNKFLYKKIVNKAHTIIRKQEKPDFLIFNYYLNLNNKNKIAIEISQIGYSDIIIYNEKHHRFGNDINKFIETINEINKNKNANLNLEINNKNHILSMNFKNARTLYNHKLINEIEKKIKDKLQKWNNYEDTKEKFLLLDYVSLKDDYNDLTEQLFSNYTRHYSFKKTDKKFLHNGYETFAKYFLSLLNNKNINLFIILNKIKDINNLFDAKLEKLIINLNSNIKIDIFRKCIINPRKWVYVEKRIRKLKINNKSSN